MTRFGSFKSLQAAARHRLKGSYWQLMVGFVRHLLHRIEQDRMTVVAGYLAYVTLLSLVPLLAVVFAVMSGFPMFADLKQTLENFVFQHFVPTSTDVVQQNIRNFLDNISRMTAVGVSSLMVVALMLISAVDQTLNDIWRVHKKRRWRVALPIYWMILTLGPILIGASLAITSYLVSLSMVDDSALGTIGRRLLKLVPYMFSGGGFLLLYLVVPNCVVRLRHALAGATLAAVLFELGKVGFALYITRFPSYQAIYGALAAIPILFVWIYLCWLIVLIGAELTASLGEFADARMRSRNEEVREDRKNNKVNKPDLPADGGNE